MIEKYELWGHVWREWGYEIRIDFYFDGNIENLMMTFSNIPSDEELQTSISNLENDVIFRYNSIQQENLYG